MAKKTIDLTPKADKITDEQLQELQSLINEVNSRHLSIGQLEVQKAGMIQGIGQLQAKLREVQGSLEEEYGKVSVNIQDGSISELPQDETNKKD